MGNIKKSERLKQKELLKYFNRDSEIYKNFEQSTHGLSKREIVYYFIDECKFRDTCNIIGGICATFNNIGGFDFSCEDEIQYQDLYDIDIKKHDYFVSVLSHSKSVLHDVFSTKKSKPVPTFNKALLLEKFGGKTVQELHEDIFLNNKKWKYYGDPVERYIINNHLLIKKNSNRLIKELDENTFEGLYDVDKMKREYCMSLLMFPHKYRVYNSVSKSRLIEIFGKDLLVKYDYINSIDNIFLLTRQLTDVQNQRLKESVSKNSFEVKTIIKKEYSKSSPSYSLEHRDKTVLVEIDFTKPKEEILEYMKYLYDEYEDKKILDTFEFLNIKHTLPNHDKIYSEKGNKAFNMLLADKLFAYDAYKMGLTISSIQKSIDKCVLKSKNINDIDELYEESNKDKIGDTTIRNYLKLMFDLIENNGTKGF